MKTINTVAEYLEHIDSIVRIPRTTHTVGCFTFFRGQSNSSWNVSPSLFRKNLFYAENLLLTEIKHTCPSEMMDNQFDTLVKMQHYGMPTRLLDTTTNPLVALYFACESNTEKECDGAVYAFPNMPTSWSSDALVDLIMDFVFNYYPLNVQLDQMLELSKTKYFDEIHRLMPENIDSLLHYLTIPALAVMPAKTNPRIEAQDGAFIIFGMQYRDRKVSTNPGTLGKVYYNFVPTDVCTPEKIWHLAETLIIPASAKDRILEQLDSIGINEGKLFPDLSHQITHTVKCVKRDMLKPKEET